MEEFTYRLKLRKQFKEEEHHDWENDQGEPDIDYVLWLEKQIHLLKKSKGRLK